MVDIDPAALAAKIAAGLRAGLEQDPHVIACTPGLIGIVATYLDAAAPMIAAALERDTLARDLAAALARVAELEAELRTARNDALEEAASVARRVVRRPLNVSDPHGAAVESAAAAIERDVLGLRALAELRT